MVMILKGVESGGWENVPHRWLWVDKEKDEATVFVWSSETGQVLIWKKKKIPRYKFILRCSQSDWIVFRSQRDTHVRYWRGRRVCISIKKHQESLLSFHWRHSSNSHQLLLGTKSFHWVSVLFWLDSPFPASVDGPDQNTDRLHGVEPSAIFGPENPVLEFAAIDASGVPDTVEIGLSTSVVPPASLMEMGTVTWNRHLSFWSVYTTGHYRKCPQCSIMTLALPLLAVVTHSRYPVPHLFNSPGGQTQQVYPSLT